MKKKPSNNIDEISLKLAVYFEPELTKDFALCLSFSLTDGFTVNSSLSPVDWLKPLETEIQMFLNTVVDYMYI